MYGTYTTPEPDCTVAEPACTYFQASWASAWSDYLSSSSPSPKGFHCSISKPEPTSTWQPPPEPKCSDWPERCIIQANGAKKLYYWPVTTVDGDFCQQNGSTITPEPTIAGVPNTAVVDGHTFTSPTNYVWLNNARAAISSNYREIRGCGPPYHESVLVPITKTLSTIGADASTSSLNFADLNQPIPGDAWDASWQCRQRRCLPPSAGGPYVIEGEGEMMPVVAIPTEVIELEDEWVSVGCTRMATWLSWSMTPVPLQTPPPRPF